MRLKLPLSQIAVLGLLSGVAILGVPTSSAG